MYYVEENECREFIYLFLYVWDGTVSPLGCLTL